MRMRIRIVSFVIAAALFVIAAPTRADGPTCDLNCGDGSIVYASGTGYVYAYCSPGVLGQFCDPWGDGDASCQAGLWCSACSGECESGAEDCGCVVVSSEACP